MLIEWTNSPHCRSRTLCARCRNPGDVAFRRTVERAFTVADWSACPAGLTMAVPVGKLPQPPRAAPQPLPPSWAELRAEIAARFPNWEPELNNAIAGASTCTPCQDVARRRRWAARLAAAPPVGL